MTARLSAALALLLALSTAACNPMEKTPDIQQNPHPKVRYELTLTIEDAPGPFEVMGHMQYEVADRHCSPEDSFTGAQNPPHTNIPITFTPAGPNVYTGTVYLDLLQDKDYYGLGVCHWQMVAAIVEMKAHDVTFSPYIKTDMIISQQSKTQYFPKSAYGDPLFKGSSVTGLLMSDPTVARYRDIFFSTTLSAKEARS